MTKQNYSEFVIFHPGISNFCDENFRLTLNLKLRNLQLIFYYTRYTITNASNSLEYMTKQPLMFNKELFNKVK